jgi:hypothetical protein
VLRRRRSEFLITRSCLQMNPSDCRYACAAGFHCWMFCPRSSLESWLLFAFSNFSWNSFVCF